jgi:hypothetical protein
VVGVGDLPCRLGEASRGHPDPDPAVSEPPCSCDGRVGSAANDHGRSRDWRRAYGGVVNVEEAAGEVDGVAREEPYEQLERLVHSRAPSPGIHATEFQLPPVVAPEADAEAQPPRGDGAQGGQLPRDRSGMP